MPMPTCTICGEVNFFRDSGFYFCVECQTQSQDVREVMDDDDAFDENGDVSAFHDSNMPSVNPPNDSSNDDTLTIWEGFNFALIGLVDELIKIGAKPALKSTVLQLWSKYLQQMEIAFNPDETALPKLGPNFRKIDAKLIFGHFYESCKKKENESPQESLQVHTTETETDLIVKKKIVRSAKKAVLNQTYEKALSEMNTPSHTLANMTLDMLSSQEQDEQEEHQETLASQIRSVKLCIPHHPGLLLRNRLIAFLYLGILVSEENIKLSDLLRWVLDRQLSYNALWKFFPSAISCGSSNSALFLQYQPAPSYSVVLKMTCQLAKYLQLNSYKIPSMKDLIGHYIVELNLPEQIGFAAVRLLSILPTPTEYCSFKMLSVMLPNIEARAMAHILVAMKLIFSLDDTTEHINSNIARKLNALILSKGESLEFFVWEEWERFCTLKKTALSLFHPPSFMKNSIKDCISTIQNAEPTLSEWDSVHEHNILSEGARQKVLKQTLKSYLTKIGSQENSSDTRKSESIIFPPSTAPYTTYIKAIVNWYRNTPVKFERSEWEKLKSNFPYEKLSIDFGKTSIEYLTHSSRFVDWARSHGLEVGLHMGSLASSISFSPYVPKCISLHQFRKFYRVKVTMRKRRPTRSSSSAETSTPCLREYKFRKPVILPNLTSNAKGKGGLPLPRSCELQTNKTPKPKRNSRYLLECSRLKKSYIDHVSKSDKKKMLFVPHTEYWHSESCYPQYDHSWWESEKEKLPHSFEYLLNECASLIELKPEELYKEMLHIEAFHEAVFPPEIKPFSNCDKHEFRLNKIKEMWQVPGRNVK